MLNTVASLISATFGLPMMRRLTEYSAIITRMLASSCMIRSRTLSQAVSMPARPPASSAAAVAASGFQPATISAAATAPPSGKLPSTVRSGKLMILKDRKTPSATSPKIRPISMAPSDAMRDMRCVRAAWLAAAPYCTTTLADFSSASDSVTPCFCAAPGLTCSSKVLLVCEAILPGASPLRMRTTSLPVWRPMS